MQAAHNGRLETGYVGYGTIITTNVQKILGNDSSCIRKHLQSLYAFVLS